MTMDPYRLGLERDLARLRHKRVELRRTLDWFSRGHIWQDATETSRLVHETQMRLKSTDIEWNELCHRLGRRDLMVPRKPVSLRLTAEDKRRLARQGTVRKSVEPMPDSFRSGADWLAYCRRVCR
jgi:hypothetical protein